MKSNIPLNLRSAVSFLETSGELINVTEPVSRVHEIAGILKALDDGPALLFENVIDFPTISCLGNVVARRDNLAALLGLDDHREVKSRFHQAIQSPIPPEVVIDAPCQEKVITGDIDIHRILPIITHTPDDAGPVLAGGVVMWADLDKSQSELSFKRMFFRGKDWGTLNVLPGTHLHNIIRNEFENGSDRVALTVNIGVPLGAMVTAAGAGLRAVLPDGCDEIGIAGAAQGAPLALVKAKTVDAWALAESEIVIEGYVLAEEVFETDAAETAGKPRATTFFPEWLGYQGKALKTHKFVITAITHRADRPIFHNPLGTGYEYENLSHPLREGCILEICAQSAPGLVRDLTIPFGTRSVGGLVVQVKKRILEDDTLTRELIGRILKTSLSRLVVAVDEDVDIYSADDVLWAITSRMHNADGIQRTRDGYPSLGYVIQEYSAASGYGGGEGMGFDATALFAARPTFKRAHYPSDRMDLNRWFTEAQVTGIRTRQSDYARLLAQIGG